jgi:hypothetical protein
MVIKLTYMKHLTIRKYVHLIMYIYVYVYKQKQFKYSFLKCEYCHMLLYTGNKKSDILLFFFPWTSPKGPFGTECGNLFFSLGQVPKGPLAQSAVIYLSEGEMLVYIVIYSLHMECLFAGTI